MTIITILILAFVIGIFYSIFNDSVENKRQADLNAKFKERAKKFRERYGECTLAIRPRTYMDNNTDTVLVYDEKKVIAINHAVFYYSDILDFNINNDVSYKTSTSTGSMVGRVLVGGVLLGGVGALAGATTANKKSVKETSIYKINITVKNMKFPMRTYITTEPINAQQMIAVLKNIIDYNENLEK